MNEDEVTASTMLDTELGFIVGELVILVVSVTDDSCRNIEELLLRITFTSDEERLGTTIVEVK